MTSKRERSDRYIQHCAEKEPKDSRDSRDCIGTMYRNRVRRGEKVWAAEGDRVGSMILSNDAGRQN